MYDVIVIGAGPSGSVTAQTVAQAGYSVLVLEKNQMCRSPCAGYISNTINIDMPASTIVQSKIAKMRTYFPDLSFHEHPLNGFVVDRPSFDTALAIKAQESGTEIKWDSPLTCIVSGKIEYRGGKAEGRVIVGADGVFSKTASLLGLDRQKLAVCAQYHLRGFEIVSQTAEIFFNARYAPGGYAWIYPAGKDSAKVGVGLTGASGESPSQYLDDFISDSEISKRFYGRKTEFITGALPVSGLREKLCFQNVLLVGDSAGMADPVTGAGINNAMLAGEIAGKTIIEALEMGNLNILGQYEARIIRLLGKPLKRALEKRKRMDICLDNKLLQQNLPGLWVTFKQYRE